MFYGTVYGHGALGMQASIGPVLIGFMGNAKDDLKDRDEAPDFASDNDYLTDTQKFTNVYAFNFNIDVLRIFMETKHSFYFGISNATRVDTEYRESKIGYWYKVVKSTEEKTTALDLQYHVPLFDSPHLIGIVGWNTNNDVKLGLGYKF